MSLTIFWVEEAKETFDIIAKSIEDNWGILAASKFISNTNRKINLIASQPYMFKASISENVRQAIITGQTSMYYEVYPDRIVIIFFLDNRQEPII